MINVQKGLINYSWDKVKEYSEEEITYFLFLDGFSKEAIAKIRKLDRTQVDNHLITGKIKYRFLAKAKSSKELLELLTFAGKDDKLSLLLALDDEKKRGLLNFIKDNYTKTIGKDKETAIWIIGELKDEASIDILIKASVHKYINVRRMAISAIGKLMSKKGETALIRGLSDENPQVIAYAIKALSKINSLNAKEKIEELSKKSSNEAVLRACERYFQEEETCI